MTQQLPILKNAANKLPQSTLERWGWELPARYGETDFDLWSSGRGVLDISFFGAVFLNGPDRGDYLNRRCSNKVVGLADREHRRAFILSAVGKIDADFDVYQDEPGERFLLITAPYKAANLSAEIDKYIFSEQCAVQEIESFCAVATLAESLLLEDCAFAKLSGEPEAYLFRSDVFAGATICLLPNGTIDQAAHLLAKACNLTEGNFVGWNAFEKHRIEQGITLFGADLLETTIPLEANLERGLHDDKGCYPGQETIATITNLGHPARKFLLFRAQESLNAGTAITAGLNGSAVGEITSAVAGETSPVHALGFVKWRYRDGTTELFAGGVPLTILSEVEKRNNP